MGLFNQDTILGLDIGSHSIKLAEVKHTREGAVITCAKAIQISREQEKDTEYIADIAIADALRELIDKSTLRSKRVVTAVSSALEEQVTILSSFFIPELIPDLPKEDIKTNVMMEAEVQARIPFPADFAVADCNILEETTFEGKKGLEVFFVAVHRDLIDSQFRLLRSVGLIPIAIDVDFLALARLLGFTNQILDHGNVAIIDIGASKTSVGFYQNGKLRLYPHVPVAGDYLTDEVSKQLSVDWEEAEELKKNEHPALGAESDNSVSNHGSLSAVSAQAGTEGKEEDISLHEEQLSTETSEVIQWALDHEPRLCSQLQSRFDYYEADFPNFKPSKILAAGGTSQLPNLDELLTSRFSIPVESVSYLENIPVDAKGDVSEIKGNEPLFATAVGLALKKNL